MVVHSASWVAAGCAGVTASQRAELYSAHGVSLAQCLQDQGVTEIILTGDYALRNIFDKAAPLKIARDVTLRGPHNITPDERPVLDMRFVYGAVELCSSCTFTLADLVITNDRKGSGPLYDLFTGKPGSKVRSINTFRLRPACTPAETQLKSYDSLERSKLFPDSSAPQGIRLRDVTYKGKVYPDSVWADNTSFDAPYRFDEARGGAEGGYAAMAVNSTRLCEHYVSKQCLEVLNADACVQQLLDSLAAGPSKPQGLSPSIAVAIIVPLVAGFLLAGGVVAWWLRRHMQRRAQGSDGSKAAHDGPQGPLLSSRTTGGSCADSQSAVSTDKGLSARSAGRPQGGTKGWEVLDSQTSPSMGVVQDDGIELGDFIGAGSFGKVYRGRWNGIDVAVKVIEHSGTTAAAVEEEVSLMMAFQHPNIVKAYHCIHYTHREAAGRHSESNSCSTFAHSRHGSGVPPTQSNGSTPPSGSFAVPATAAARSAGAGGSSSSGASAPAAATAGAAAVATTPSPELGRPASGAAAAASTGGSDTAMTVQPVHHRVHFDDQLQHPRSSFDAGLLPSSCDAASASQLGSMQQQQQPGTESWGSSTDCRCLAASGTPDGLRSRKSSRGPASRFESWLVLELCDRGSLGSYTLQWPMPAQDQDSMLRLLQLLLDTAHGLQELHRVKVVHGDLNARNVLVASCSEAAYGVQCKLADFGLSRSVKQHQTHRTTNTIGTMNYMAPEMLRLGKMSVFADIYSLGILMWELYTGEDAFQRLQHPGQFFETVVLNDLRPPVPEDMPADYRDLMQQCWATEPSARPTASNVAERLQGMLQRRQAAAAASTSGTGVPQGAAAAAGAAPALLPAGLAHPMQPGGQQHLPPAVGADLPAGTSQQHVISADGSSSGKLPAFLAGLRSSSTRQEDLDLEADAGSLSDRGPSWSSTQQAPGTGGLGYNSWFV